MSFDSITLGQIDFDLLSDIYFIDIPIGYFSLPFKPSLSNQAKEFGSCCDDTAQMSTSAGYDTVINCQNFCLIQSDFLHF